MQSFRELTDLEPQDVLSEEDLVLFKKREPCSLLEPLPNGIRTHGSGPFQSLSRDALVASHQAGRLRDINVEVAVFAGCPRFICSQRFREAAGALCARADTVVVVHNLNAMTDLLALFPGVGTLHLLHDLVAHGAPKEEDRTPNGCEVQADVVKKGCEVQADGDKKGCEVQADGDKKGCEDQTEAHKKGCEVQANGDRKRKMAPSSEHTNTGLRSLYGDCCALGLNHLFMDREVAGSLVADYVQLAELDTNLERLVEVSSLEEDLKQASGDAGTMRQWSSLVLGSSLHSRQTYATADMVRLVAKHCPGLRHLQICVAAKDAVFSVGEFKELRSLSVLFSTTESPRPCPYSAVASTLPKLPLELLVLRGFADVSLAGLAESCPGLRRLQLVDCELCDLDVADQALPHMDELEVGSVHPKGLRRLMAACPNLTSLAIRDRVTSSYFMRASCPKTKLRKLRRLELNADGLLSEMGLDERDLQKMVEILPSLAHVAVDSFEVRFYLDRYARHVRLGWSTCTFCAAKFPQWNAEHAELWAKVHKSHQAGCGDRQRDRIKGNKIK